ncbi:MAG: bifunctional 4-hydroxy-2-oxoglutarate aldolase/2-dehydro-3-deoxy-phosphogluconate aldolase [Chitinophagaceae bacterium]|nr:bifunctional 4-hydroxy-2-oxoglutarate aldolase/2-dehydro-3-deoxy-phosphogluconate aldolase [Chitinophagaceae bacterium]MCW5925350.1 bifunctional 4-hydroxy-2-oxoglutarate aldolase/2-dehydro-3-deoxy-phosphogluconate aldolase [Chitinophagaceae bacterium]
MTPREISSQVKQSGFMPLFSSTDLSVSKNVLKASFEGGVRLFEFTNRSANSFEIFTELRKYCDKELPEMVLGIGTIKNRQQAQQFIDAGADFLISPLILEEIHEVAGKHNKLWMPGCATPTEIGLAENFGIETVKIFPAKQLGGPAYIKAVKAVFPNMQFLTTGGVEPTADDLKKWFDAGTAAVGIGSQLFPADWLANNQYDLVTEQIKNIIGFINDARKG